MSYIDPKAFVKLIETISGRPNRRNKQGYGALQWLANELDVDYTTIWRWIKKEDIPDWAKERIDELVSHESSSVEDVLGSITETLQKG